MKAIVILPLIVACLACGSASPEPIGKTEEQWADTCQQWYLPPDLTTCTTLIYWECKDGSKGSYVQQALLSDLLGTPCLYDGKTYYYTCAIYGNYGMLVCGDP